MNHDVENPARAGRGAPKNLFSLAANKSENKPKALELQEIRAAFIARKYNVAPSVALIVAPLAFGMEAAR